MDTIDRKALQQEYMRLRERDAFDDEWYVREYPDVSASGLAPIEHYVCIGRELNRSGRRIMSGEDRPRVSPFSLNGPKLLPSDIFVSVLCITYNHENFIRQALEGFIAQRTNFPVEFIVGDDCSTDGTAAIIEHYAKKDSRIVPVIRGKNIGVYGNFADLASRASGPYVAMCEGDDYWTDSYKLQKQADFLSHNLEYSLVYHPVEVVHEDGIRGSYIFPVETKPSSPIWELAAGNFIQTNSVMYRWRYPGGLSADIYPEITPLDWFLHLMHAEVGRVGCLNEIMGIYRKHAGGMWANSHSTRPHRRLHGLGELAFYRALSEHFSGILNPVFSGAYQLLFNQMAEDALVQGAYGRLSDMVRENAAISISSFLPLSATDGHEQLGNASSLEETIKSKVKVSVVVLSHNHENYIKQCVESLIAQIGPFELEIIIGDDCSHDATPVIAAEYARRDSRIKYMGTEVNLGMLQNMSRCLNACTGEFIAFCEGDDYWLSEKKLLRQLLFLLQRKEFSMCFNRVLLLLEEDGVFIPHGEQGGLDERLPTSYLASHPVTANFSCCMYRASSVNKIPQYYFSTKGAADWLFNILVGGTGKLGFLNEILSVYRVHPKGQWSGLHEQVQANLFAEARQRCSRSIGAARGFDDYQVKYQVVVVGGQDFHRDYRGTLDSPITDQSGLIEGDAVELSGWVVSRTGKRARLRIRREETLKILDLTERRADVSTFISSETNVFCHPNCGFRVEVPFSGPIENYFVDVESCDQIVPWLKVTARLWCQEV